MKFNNFEKSIIICFLFAWFQFIFINSNHGFFMILGLILICLMEIIGYLRMILELK